MGDLSDFVKNEESARRLVRSFGGLVGQYVGNMRTERSTCEVLVELQIAKDVEDAKRYLPELTKLDFGVDGIRTERVYFRASR